MSLPAAGRDRLRRRGFRLEYASMTWMVAEATVAITAGLAAASIALVGFGLDSVLELLSAAIVIWQLRGEIAGVITFTILSISEGPVVAPNWATGIALGIGRIAG